jgi:DNA-binding transcriptional MerR regulator
MAKQRKNRKKNNKINNVVITAGDIMKRFNVSYQTVNHYTDFGLLRVVFKKGNARFYNKKEVKFRLAKIAKLAREGYSLRLIRRKLIGW